jgi:broad specificity phosphatase PhoE
MFFIIRHPETEWHILGKLQGHKDSKLTEAGKKTAMKFGKSLKNKDITKIISSDLGRCSQTAKIVAEIIKVPVEYSHELRERNFGELNGKPNKYVLKEFDLNDPDLTSPGGESFNAMKSRVISYLKKISNNKKDTILFVTYEGCIRALLSEVYSLKFTDFKCDSSSDFIYRFLVDSNNIKLKEIMKSK